MGLHEIGGFFLSGNFKECSRGHKNCLSARFCWVCGEFLPRVRAMVLPGSVVPGLEVAE